MSEKKKGKRRKVVYRKRHKSLTHLTEDVSPFPRFHHLRISNDPCSKDTKHAFEERIQGELRHLSSEPVYLGVSSLSAVDANTFFETVTVDNYQEISKQMDFSERRSSNRGASQTGPPRAGKRSYIKRRHPDNRPRSKDGTRPPIESWAPPDTFMEEHNLATHYNVSDTLNGQSASLFPNVPPGPIAGDQVFPGPYHTTPMPVEFPLLLPEQLPPPLPHRGDASPVDSSETIIQISPGAVGLQYMDLHASIPSMTNYSTVNGGQAYAFLSYFDTSLPDRH